MKEYKTTPEKDKAMFGALQEAYIKVSPSYMGNYEFFTNNCAFLPVQVFKAGGIDLSAGLPIPWFVGEKNDDK